MADYVLSAKGTYDGSDFDSGIEGSQSKLNGLMEAARDIGQRIKSALGDGLVKTADTITSSIGGIGAAVAGIAVHGGMARALSIEQARYKLKQMGLDVTSIMASAQKSVDGTRFGLDAAATSATMLGTSGVAAGEEMTRSLQSAAGMATISGGNMEDMATIMAKVAAQGKLQGDELMQFSEHGINATQALADKLGVTQAEVRELVSKGKVDFKTFSDAMYDAFGTAAQGANDTFSGAMANMRAALSRTGLLFTSPMIGALTPTFSKIREVINACNAALGPLGDSFAAFLGMTPELDELGNKTGSFLVVAGGRVDKFISLLDGLKSKIEGLGEGGFKNLSAGAKLAAAAIALLSVGSMGALVSQIPIVGGALGGLFGTLGKLSTPVGTLVGSFGKVAGAFKGASVAVAGLQVPMLGIVAVVALLAAGFVAMLATNEGFRNQMASMAASIGKSLAPAFQAIVGLLPTVAALFRTVMNTASMLAPPILAIVDVLAQLVSTIVTSAVPIIQQLATILSTVVMQVVGRLAPIISRVVGLIVDAMPTIQQVIVDAMAAVQQVIEAVWPTLQEIIVGAMAAIQGAFLTAWPLIQSVVMTALTAIQAIVEAVIPVVRDAIVTAWPYIQSIVETAMAAIQAVMELVWPIVEALVTSSMGVIQAVVGTVLAAINGDWDGVWNGMQAIHKAVWDGIKNVLKAATDTISKNLDNVLKTLQALWNSVWNAVKTLFSNVWNAITSILVSTLSNLLSSVGNWIISVIAHFTNMDSQTVATIRSMWANVVSQFRQGANNVLAKVGEIPSKIKGLFANAGSWLVNSGASMMAGLARGIANSVGSAVSAVSGAISRVRSLFPFSPAKEGPFSGRGWVLYSGMSIMDALAEGADRRASKTVDAYSDVIGKIRDSLDVGSVTYGYKLDYQSLAPNLPAQGYGNVRPGAATDGQQVQKGGLSIYIGEMTVRDRDDADYFAEVLYDKWSREEVGSL